MKKMYNYLKLIPVILMGSSLSASAQLVAFPFTGGSQTYTVPANVNVINITAEGATGASSTGVGTSPGAKGGLVTCDLSVTPGQVLTVYVGGAGASGGYNGGGGALGIGGIGGGASDVRFGAGALTDRVVVAGGGGGAGYDCATPGMNRGGQGGGLSGQDGFLNSLTTSSYAFGGGSTAPPVGPPGTLLGLGGVASGTNGGGGGGGYYGGLGGVNNSSAGPAACGGYGGGGGGSSYYDLTKVYSYSTTNIGGSTSGSGNGSISICAPGVAGTIIVPDSVCVGSTVTFSDGTGSSGGVWSSSNTGYATVVPSTGDVTGVAPGLVYISRTVTTPCGNAVATVAVNVRAYPGAITGTPSACTNTSTTLNDPTTGGTWSTVSTLISIGSTSGVVTAAKVGGTAIITYSDHGCAVQLTFTIIQGPDTVIGPTSVCESSSVQFSDATAGGTWTTSAPPAQATIDPATGVLTTATTTGNITVYYNQGGCNSSRIVEINKAPGAIFGSSSLCAGSSTGLLEFGIGGVWSSGFTSVATVDQYGTVTAVSGGPDTIYYTIAGCPPEPFPMNIDQAGPILGITTICLTSAVPLSDTSAGGVWTSSDPTVAVVDPHGLLTAGPSAMVGSTATITYKIPAGCFSTQNVTAATSAPPILGPTSICQGDTATLSDTAKGGTWSSTDLAIAPIVDTSGVVTGLKSGVVNISYTLASGCYSTESFLVKTLLPSDPGLTRFPAGDTLCQGTTVRFTVNPLYSGIGPSYTWSLFGVTMGTTDTFYYTPKHGDVITVAMKVGTGVCSASDTARDSVTYNIDSIIAPTINISLGSPVADTIKFLGQEFTFNSTVHYGGEAAKYQWYRNGAAIPGATSIYYKAAVYYTDTFFCVVTGNPPCAAPSSVSSNAIIVYNFLYKLNTQTVSNGANTVTLFPNPSKGTLTLSGNIASAANEEVNIEISDMLGRVVYTGATTTANGAMHKEITLDNSIADGTYLLHVNSSTGNEVIHFVISK